MDQELIWELTDGSHIESLSERKKWRCRQKPFDGEIFVKR